MFESKHVLSLVVWGFAVITLVFSFPVYAAEKPPIKIGVTLPLSGPLALNGQKYHNAIKLVTKKINAEGRILKGSKIELIIYDDKGNTEEAVNTIKKLINRDKVDACVTGAISAPVLAQKEVTREAKMMHVVLTAQHPKITLEGHPYLFRLNTTTYMGADAISRYVIEKLKPKTAWFLGINDDYGRDLAKRYESNFEKPGIKFLGFEYYNKDDTDFMIYLTKGKALNPGVFMMAAPANAISSTILKQRKQIGFTGPITQSPGVLAQIVVTLAGDASEGVYSGDSWVRTLDNPVNKEFIETYEKEYKPLFAGKEEAVAYESVLFLTQAMDKAGTSKDAEKIATVFRTTTFNGARGKITFDKIGQALATDYPIVVKNGQIVLAE